MSYCKTQNNSGRIPHILIVNYLDFEYVACLHNPDYKGNDRQTFIIKKFGYTDITSFKADQKVYSFLTEKKENSLAQLLEVAPKRPKIVKNDIKVSKSKFEITVRQTEYFEENIGIPSTNIEEIFQVLAEMQ